MTFHPYDGAERRATVWRPCARCGLGRAPAPLTACRDCYDAVRRIADRNAYEVRRARGLED